MLQQRGIEANGGQRSRTLAGVAVPARPGVADVLADARISGTGLLFLGYLLLVADSYLGLSRQFAVLMVLHVPTLMAWTLMLGVIAKVGPKVFVDFRQSTLITGLVAFTAISVLYAYVQMNAYEAFRVQLDNLILFAATAYLMDRLSRIRVFAIMASGLIVLLVLRNLDMLGSSARQSGFAAGYFMTDGNDFAWGLIVLLPMALFLMLNKNSWYVRYLGMVAALAVVLGVVGTQSRGGTLALVAAGLFYLVFIARRKMLGAAFCALVVVVGLAMAPAEYMGRMESIATYDEDNSARGRLQAWGIAVQMALDHPLGVGADNFNSAYGRVYLPKQESNALTWGQGRWLSPHSIYFRALGEYGVLGLALLLTIIGTSILDNLRVRRALLEKPDPPGLPLVLPGLVAMSLVGYAVSGAFLGGLTYPHLFILAGLTAGVRRLSAVQLKAAIDSQPATAPSSRGQSSAIADRRRPGLVEVNDPAVSNYQLPARFRNRSLRAR